MKQSRVIEELSDGLVIRTATPEDADQLAQFNEETFRDEESGTDAWWISEWTRDLLAKPHPTLRPEDIIIVEDRENSRIASTTTYLSQEWSYEGIPFQIGRPEIVATAPEYRNRGLIRRQFEIMHEWGDQRQHDISVVLGIPYYYRQFGYEMAIDGEGERNSNMLNMPRWSKDEERAYRMRDAVPQDISFITKCLQDSAKRSLVSPVFKQHELRYMTFDRNPRSAVYYRTGVLCKTEGETLGQPVGVMMYGLILPIDQAIILRIEMSEPRYWKDAMPSLLKEFEEKARLESEKDSDPERQIKNIRVDMQPGHHAYIFDDGALGKQPATQYAWYVRVAYVARFIRRIAPALERRIAESVHEGLTQEVNIVIGRYTVVIEFQNGVIKSVRKEGSPKRSQAVASFPDLTFLQALFGRRSVSELVDAFPDCYTKSVADRHLIETLFPKKTSDLSLTLI